MVRRLTTKFARKSKPADQYVIKLKGKKKGSVRKFIHKRPKGSLPPKRK